MKAPARRRRMRNIAVTLFSLLLLAAAGSAAGVWWLLAAPEADSRPVEFEVLPGWGANRIAAELKEEGLVRSAQAFAYYLRWQQLDRSVGEGLYDLDPGSPAAETARVLVQGGRPRIELIVIPEGFRARDVVTRLAAAELGSSEQFTELIQNPAGLERDPLPGQESLPERLEGYLFPASYEIPVRSSPEQVLGLFLDRFEQELTPEVQARLDDLGLSVQDWVVLASVVQSEAGSDEEMPVIAGVFLNRLEQGMPLQSDPTVAYGLNKDLPELSAVNGDLQEDHAWNTYTRPGLPESPISNPGRAALHAVLAPERADPAGVAYLYFLHGRADGEPVFRPNTNYDAHLRDIELYLR